MSIDSFIMLWLYQKSDHIRLIFVPNGFNSFGYSGALAIVVQSSGTAYPQLQGKQHLSLISDDC